MGLCSSASHLRCTSKTPSKSTNHILSRALTAHHLRITENPPHNHLSDDHQTFTGGGKPSKPFALDLSTRIPHHGSLFDPYFLNKVVAFCAKNACFCLGVQVHNAVFKMGFASNVYICTALVDMYSKCGEVSSARRLFDEAPERNAVTWNSLISGYLNVNCPRVTVELFVEMLREGMDVTPFGVSSCLVACTEMGAREIGAQVHGLILKEGFAGNVVVGTGLIDMYSKCCDVEGARRVFDHMLDRNVVTWTSMVTGYAQNERPDEAMVLVRDMARLGLSSNHITYNSLLSSFCGKDYMNFCRQVHCCIIRLGFDSNEHIGVTLVTVYSKCSNSLEDFEKLCSGITRSDQISWNSIIAGYYNLGYEEEALKCFCEMRQAGIDIDFYTLTSVLGAIGNISALEEGKEWHALIFKTGYASNVFIQNGLVSMYARSGAIDDSKKVFWSMEEHDVISWNALITGCARHGYGREAVELFEQMKRTEIKPDSTTFLAVLSACSHVGFVDKGLEYFDLMRSGFLSEPLRVEHYASVVDIFGRAGYLKEAEAFIDSMAVEPGPSVYKALLSACLVYGNREIAMRTAKKFLELWPDDPGTYVLLSNVLRACGSWDDAADTWKLMCNRGARKPPGYSWV